MLPLFIEQSSLATDVDRQGFDPSAVKMMTLHSSKGLEFPVVFVVGMEEGLFPSLKPWESSNPEDIEEERRLCYVGMTRAREKLYLCHAGVRRIWGSFSYQEHSRFLDEISPELVDYRDMMIQSGVRSEVIRVGNHKPRSRLESELIGRKVHHLDYGDGTIIDSEGFGKTQKVQVEFLGRVRKKFLLSYIVDCIET